VEVGPAVIAGFAAGEAIVRGGFPQARDLGEFTQEIQLKAIQLKASPG